MMMRMNHPNFPFQCFRIIHSVFYKDYQKNPDIIKEYDLTKDEQLIIKHLFFTDPSNKNLAEQLNMSESKIKQDLTGIYNKFNIREGGSKRTELVARLCHLGYKE